MNKFIGYLSFFFSLICVISLNAQSKITIDEFTEEQGLSYRWVFDVTQDNQGFLWFATYDGLNRFNGTEFDIYKHLPIDSNSLSSNIIRHVSSDHQGNIWTYNEDQTFNRIHLATGKISRINAFFKNGESWSNASSNMGHFAPLSNGEFIVLFQDRSSFLSSLWIFDDATTSFQHLIDIQPQEFKVDYFSECADGKIWIWALGAGYYLFDISKKEIVYKSVMSQGNIDDFNISVPVDENRNFWYPNAFANSNTGENLLNTFLLPEDLEPKNITNIRMDNLANIWINHGEEELYYFNTKTKILEKFKDPAFGRSMDFRSMSHFYIDQEGASWNGNFYGALRIKKQTKLFDNYANDIDLDPGEGQYNFSAREMVELSPERLLVKEHRYGLYIFDLESRQAKKMLPNLNGPNHPAPAIYSFLLSQDGNIYVCQTDSLYRINLETNKRKSLFRTQDIDDSRISIFEDAGGNLWVISEKGAFIYDKITGKLLPIDFEHQINTVHASFEYGSYDAEENKIYGFYDQGLYIIDCATKSAQLIEIFSHPERELLATAILKWKKDFWICTKNGLIQFNPETQVQTIYNRSKGLPSDIIYSAIGAENTLWLATHNGLCRFDPYSMKMTTFYKEQGLSYNEFNRWSYLKASTGRLYFGGLNGIVGFNPDELILQEESPGQINLTGFSKFDQKTGKFLDIKHLPYSGLEKLTIKPHERTLFFKYYLNRYDDVRKNQYFHYMEGLERDWVEDGFKNEVRYFQIPPGKYVFHTKAIGPNKIFASNELSIPIVVLQYWYFRWWAINSYVIIFLLIISLIYKIQLNKRLVKEEANRIKELGELKANMYANITHEFRTPLTVMLGMNDAVLNYAEKGEQAKILHANEMISRSGNRLLDLVNQMLELSKLEAGLLTIHYSQGDIVSYLKYCLESFLSLACEKNIKLHFYSEADQIYMDYDAEKIRKILSNLISNALKFTPAQGHIYVDLKILGKDKLNPALQLKIMDTGIGIEEDKLANIFDRFYQVEKDNTRSGEGTGIGLSLVKQLIILLEGKISVQSSLNKGTSFMITLPILNVATKASESLESNSSKNIHIGLGSIPENEDIHDADSDIPLILIVEDNSDVAHYIHECIKKDYRTDFAQNGTEGVIKAFQSIPDLIISDVMMPEKTGLELCEILKKDERTSHIPIILLTAKVDEKSKIKGLEYGADAYLAKPFNEKELSLRLINLLTLRKEVQKHYASIDFNDQNIVSKNFEDAFLLKFRGVILEQFDENDLNLTVLCQKMLLSRAQLHRKMVGLTGQSSSVFVRKVQLEKSKELLLSTEKNISEIAYMAGFKTLAHFSRVFTESYGISPSEYRKSN